MNDKKLSTQEQLAGFEEKRSYPRVVIETPVSLSLPGSKVIEAQVYDISFEGLQIHCDQETAILLRNENPADIEISFTVPLNEKPSDIKARCVIMYILELINETHAMGLKFTGIEAENLQGVRQFIESSMETD
jgi:hypothetical protein